ncbi:SurA N-terminal domain-containing protein [Afifella sp. IM 167]|uniref:SurA N-terminal domain-containing protein n=1 Tax=Afifella sp. IM 167 TaxID=2033586 RepID=UPI001CCDA7F5|nr:SurA N-terminal domain-containing protein [Afifella sp. IM 167]MBZ8131725.1 peptidylprolyl isomerase [Afifella sp. IM 167]
MFVLAKTRKAAALTLIASLGLALCFAPQALAQSSIKILVNDQPITTYDIRNRAKFLHLTSRGQAGEKQATDELINEALKMQEAKRRNVSVSEQEVNAAFATIAQRAKMPVSGLESALRQAGVDPSTLKDRIRAELAWRDIVRARFRATVRISESDVAEALGGRGEDEQADGGVMEWEAQPILFIVPKNGSSGALAQKKREAEAFRSRFKSCDETLEQTRGMKGVVVQPHVRRPANEFPENVQPELKRAQVGTALSPLKVDEGFQVLGLCSKRTISGASAAADQAREELANERGQLLARRYLRDLKSDAVIEYR